jgi:hypothetical protein
MKIRRITKYLKVLRAYRVDEPWIKENKKFLLAFIERNPVRRFGVFDMGVEGVLRESKLFNLPVFASVLAGVLVIFLLLGGGAIFMNSVASPSSLAYSVKHFGEKVNCFLSKSNIEKLNCQVAQAEKRLEEVQKMLELKGLGHGREAFELTLNNYVQELKKAEYRFVRLAAVEEDVNLILEAAKKLERVKNHQEIIANVGEKAAVDASREAEKQILRVEVSLEETSSLAELPSVKDLNDKLMEANSEILNLEVVILTLKSFYGYVPLLKSSEGLSLARGVLSEAKVQVETGRYIEAVDKLADVFKLIIKVKDEIKKLEPNLNLNIR